MNFFTIEQFTGTLKTALLLARVPPARADNIVQAAAAVVDLTIVTHANAMILITSIVRQSTVPDPAPSQDRNDSRTRKSVSSWAPSSGRPSRSALPTSARLPTSPCGDPPSSRW